MKVSLSNERYAEDLVSERSKENFNSNILNFFGILDHCF